jgi:hypothetical protein
MEERAMGRELIGECPGCGEDPKFGDYEAELTIKFIKQECGGSPLGVDVQVTLEDHELGSFPVISVVWDDYTTGYPGGYINAFVEAFERFDLPEEIHKDARERRRLLHEIQEDMESWFEVR